MGCHWFWNFTKGYNSWLKDGLSESNGKTPIIVQDFMVMSSFPEGGRGVCEADYFFRLGLTTERVIRCPVSVFLMNK